MKLHVIKTGYFKLDGGAMFGVVPKTIWNRLNPADDNNLCTWSMRCLLLEYEDRLVLIDSGLGDKQSDKFFSYYEPYGGDTLMGSLDDLGFHPGDITDVLHTHFHFDHCGGAIIYDKQGNLVPAFPNAKYWTNQKHWDWAMNPNPREKASFLQENILPMQESGVVEMVDTEQMVELFPGVRLLFTYGHTEAMMIPHIEYKGRTVVYMADLLPSVGHIPLPYVMAYDVNPLQTLKEKGEFLNNAVEKDYVLFFEHDKDNECCTLQPTPKGPRLDKTFKLKDLI